MGSCNLNVDPLEGSALTNQRPRYDLMYSCTVSSCKTSDYPKNKPSQKKDSWPCGKKKRRQSLRKMDTIFFFQNNILYNMSGGKTLKGKKMEKIKDNKSIVKMLVEANQKGLEEAKIERDMIREASQKINEKIWYSA